MFIQEDFKVSYEITKIGSVKSWGESKNDGVTYPPSVKFRATNIENKEDKQVGVREVETIVDFQIHTKTIEQAIAIQEAIRKFRANKTSVKLMGDLPNKEGTDNILKIKSTEPLEEFCKRNNISLTPPKK